MMMMMMMTVTCCFGPRTHRRQSRKTFNFQATKSKDIQLSGDKVERHSTFRRQSRKTFNFQATKSKDIQLSGDKVERHSTFRRQSGPTELAAVSTMTSCRIRHCCQCVRTRNKVNRIGNSYCAAKIWNEIPATIGNAPTVQPFKHQLKTHLFSLTNHP